MSAIKTGGPAHPVPETKYTHSSETIPSRQTGMSIRTAIAAKCMASIVSDPVTREGAFMGEIAEWSTEYADALIAELTKDGGAL